MATALMRRALASLDEETFAGAVVGTAQAVQQVLAGLADHALGAAAPTDGWSLPDAVWVKACEKHPHLRAYPCGESCERAAKRVVARLLLQAGGSPDLAPAEARSRLVAAATRLGKAGLVGLLLEEIFFEICLDRLRRPGRLAKGFHFAKSGSAISLRAEARLRTKLRGQCRTLAHQLQQQTTTPGGTGPTLDPSRVGEACAKVFEKRPPPAKARADALVNILVGPIARQLERAEKDGAAKGYSLAPRPTRVLLHDPSPGSVSFSFKSFEDRLGTPLHSLLRDLLDLGVAVFISDLYTRRTRELARRTGLLLSARHPEAWERATEPIQRAISYLGRDDLRVYFTKLKETTQVEGFRIGYNGRCVCLFSGGLDSLAGAVWALEQGLQPILVSHFQQPQLSGIQKRLVAELEQCFGHPIEHFVFYAAKHKRPKSKGEGKTRRKSVFDLGGQRDSAMAQHLRSFLFLSAAAAVALAKGIQNVYVFENGPVALNPSICEGGVNTQTAHPHVLAEFRRVVRAVFEVKLEVQNPFAYLTKGEVLRFLERPGVRHLVAEANSCWNWFKVNEMARRLGLDASEATHDGICLPCVIRGAAVEAAKLGNHDAPYLIDLFNAYPNLDFANKLAVADLLRFCRTVLALDDAELLQRVPELSVCEVGTDSKKLAAMMRRHAQEVRQVFRARANKAFQRDFAALLS